MSAASKFLLPTSRILLVIALTLTGATSRLAYSSVDYAHPGQVDLGEAENHIQNDDVSVKSDGAARNNSSIGSAVLTAPEPAILVALVVLALASYGGSAISRTRSKKYLALFKSH